MLDILAAIGEWIVRSSWAFLFSLDAIWFRNTLTAVAIIGGAGWYLRRAHAREQRMTAAQFEAFRVTARIEFRVVRMAEKAKSADRFSPSARREIRDEMQEIAIKLVTEVAPLLKLGSSDSAGILLLAAVTEEISTRFIVPRGQPIANYAQAHKAVATRMHALREWLVYNTESGDK